MNDSNPKLRSVPEEVPGGPSVFHQIIGGLLIVGAIIAIAAAIKNQTTDAPVQENQECVEPLFLF